MHKYSAHQLLTLATFLLCVLLTTALTAQKLEGVASFYGDKFDGKPTSTGETFRKAGYTAASLDLPWGTVVEVTNLANGKTVQVRVNDCGPHARGRIIDLTRRAAEELDFVKQGEAKVRLRILQASTSGPTCYRGKWAKQLKAQGKAIPPPPAPWDPTVTAKIEPVNPVVAGPQAANPAIPVPSGQTRGMASYYADRFQGRPTSTGEHYDRNALTAASKAFPYGTMLEVTNVVNGKKVTVRVNDCGPHHPERILDLSRAAAERIELVRAGAAMVNLRVLKMGEQGPTCDRSAWAKERQAAALGAPAPVANRAPLPVTTPPVMTTSVIAPDRTPAPITYSPPVVPAGLQPENLVTAYQNQVGAFGKEDNASKLINKLLKDGFDQPYAVSSGNVIKVFTGLAATEDEAKQLQQALIAKGYPKSKIVEVEVPATDLAPPVTEAKGPATYGAVMAPEPAPAPAPAKEAYDPDAVMFGVQVGAFGSQANADKMAADLRANGFEEIYTAAVGKTYRVFAGKFYFQSQAEVLKKKVRGAGFDQASVRRVQ